MQSCAWKLLSVHHLREVWYAYNVPGTTWGTSLHKYLFVTCTGTLSWEYHYGGIRLVGLPGAGTVIQCIKEGCRGPRHCICNHWSRTCSGSFDHIYSTPTTHHSSLTLWKHRENGVYEIVIRICMVSGK